MSNHITYTHCFECGHEFEVELVNGTWYADGIEGEYDGEDVWFSVYHLRGNGWECEGSTVLRFGTGPTPPDEDRYVAHADYYAPTAADYADLDNYDPTARH